MNSRFRQSLRYLILISYFPPRWRSAGIELQALLFAEYLAKQGLEVHVVTNSERILPYAEVLRGIRVHRMFYLEPRPLRVVYYINSFIEILRIRPNMLHGIGMFPNGLIAGTTGRLLQRPVIVECMGSDVLLANPMVVALLWKFILESSQAVITEIELIRKRLSAFTKCRVDCVPNGVDIPKFQLNRKYCRRRLGLTDDEKSILYVGRLDPVKNVESLLLAFAGLRKRLEKVRLIVIGKGQELDHLREVAAKTKVSEFVDFVGGVDHEQIPKYMNAADVLVVPSHSEGNPNVILEALAAGTPIIATRVGGIPDLITDGKQGFLYSPGDAEQMTNLLSKLLRDDELQRKLSVEAKIQAERFSLPLVNKRKFERILEVMSQFSALKVDTRLSGQSL